MTDIQNIGNNINFKNQQTQIIDSIPKNVRQMSFKSDDNDRFVKQKSQPASTKPAILTKDPRVAMLEQKQKEQKKQKIKNGVVTGLGVALSAAMLLYFGELLRTRHAEKKSMERLAQAFGDAFSQTGDALAESIAKCKNMALRRAAISEYMKGPQMLSEKKISEILALDNVALKKQGEVDLEKAMKIIQHKRVPHFKMEFDTPIPICIDGEIKGAKNIDFSVIPGAFNFIVPKGCDLKYKK